MIDAGTPGDPVVMLVHGFPEPLDPEQEQPTEFNAALLDLLARVS